MREKGLVISVFIIAIAGFLAIWGLPIIISIWNDNWWLMFIYFPWFYPCILLTKIWAEIASWVMENIY